MSETILQYLQWAVPSGLGAALMWLLSRRVRRARDAKEVHDAYREMYQDMSISLQELRRENEKLYKAITKLERAVSRATACDYWSDCPIRSELPEPKVRGTSPLPQHNGQRGKGDSRKRERRGGDGAGRGRQRESVGGDGDDAEPP